MSPATELQLSLCISVESARHCVLVFCCLLASGMRHAPSTGRLHCAVQAAWSKMSTARTLSKGSTGQFSEGGFSSRAATSELSSQGVSEPLRQHLPAGRLCFLACCPHYQAPRVTSL